MKLAEGMAKAELLKSLLSESCTQIAVAGSVRRRADEVSDVEILCVPHLATDLFGDPDDSQPHSVMRRLESLGITPRLNVNGNRIAWGSRFLAGDWEGVPVDVFCCLPPAQWGCLFAIRTGPAEYSKWLVTRTYALGLRCIDGRLVRAEGADALHQMATSGTLPEVTTETEEDFFNALQLPWVHPSERRAP